MPDEPPFAEPIVLQTIFAHGVTVEMTDGVMEATFWTMHAGETPERRAIAKVALSVEAVRDGLAQTRRLLAKIEN